MESVRDSVMRLPHSLRPVTCFPRVPVAAMGVEVSHDDVVTTEVGKSVTIWSEIGRTGGHGGDVDVMTVDGDIVDDVCNGKVLGGRVTEKEGVSREVGVDCRGRSGE